jgi:hypothetical protein
MAALTELRGALGGGLAATTWTGGAAPTRVEANRVRLVPGKREASSGFTGDQCHQEPSIRAFSQCLSIISASNQNYCYISGRCCRTS